MEDKNVRYELGFSISNQGLRYGIWEFKNFEAREVIKDDKPTGEYHLKFKASKVPDNVIGMFKDEIGECDIGAIDPTGFLDLEYPIYIKIKNSMVKDNINEIFHHIDDKIN